MPKANTSNTSTSSNNNLLQQADDNEIIKNDDNDKQQGQQQATRSFDKRRFAQRVLPKFITTATLGFALGVSVALAKRMPSIVIPGVTVAARGGVAGTAFFGTLEYFRQTSRSKSEHVYTLQGTASGFVTGVILFLPCTFWFWCFV